MTEDQVWFSDTWTDLLVWTEALGPFLLSMDDEEIAFLK